ncbi:MAG: hypothetical protein ACREVO_03720 [Steroidobacteraceae bacterium]
MSHSRRSRGRHPFDDAIMAARREKTEPYGFVLEEIASLSPVTRPMFGCLAVYVADKIVLALRDKRKSPADNGIWLATTYAHHESLRQDFPRLRSIRVLQKEPTQWQLLPADDPDFEAAALRLCKLIVAGDPRIGKIPRARSPRAKMPPRRRRMRE